MASFGLFTIGSPCILKEVFNIHPMPVIFLNSEIN